MWSAADFVPRLLATTTAVMGTLTLVLCLTGLYGVLGHVVRSRTREFGVRLALGANRRSIFTLVLADGLGPVGEGLFLGIVAGTLVRAALRPLFHQHPAGFDVVTFAIVPSMILAAGAIACYVPARRATLVEPNDALRAQ